MKIKEYKGGHATMERVSPSGMYVVTLRKGAEVADKVRTDDYRDACAYFKAFCGIAKNYGGA